MNLREYGVRRPLGLSCWDPQGSISKTEVETVARLSYDQISFNTTMHVEYSTTANAAPLCLVDRSFDPSTSQRFDLNTFLDGRQRQTPSANMKKCMTALFNPEPRTESRAGIGAGVSSVRNDFLARSSRLLIPSRNRSNHWDPTRSSNNSKRPPIFPVPKNQVHHFKIREFAVPPEPCYLSPCLPPKLAKMPD